MKFSLPEKGPIAWMARNHVAANLLMVFLIAGGILIGSKVKQEVFPEVELDRVSIVVPYPGASPEEVEKGIVLPIEEAVRGLDGVKRVTASASEGSGMVMVELLLGANGDKLLQNVKNAVDRIVSFPQDAERPIVSLLEARHEVISVIVYGDVDEKVLREMGEYVRDELLLNKGIT
ncbi:MAG TPA: efflux RND transporter permease subunit, partial [Planctomycetes bacterium]|nr:efflux RND transporter permease subunit [Planctomycetota bacterium]